MPYCTTVQIGFKEQQFSNYTRNGGDSQKDYATGFKHSKINTTSD
jgi:hypothetical protein